MMEITKMIVSRAKRFLTSVPHAAKEGKTESRYRFVLCSNGSVFFVRKRINAANAYSLCSSRSFVLKVGAMISSNMSRLNVSSDTGDRAPSSVNIRPFQNCFKLAQSVSQGGAIMVPQYLGYASAGEGNPVILR